MKSKEGAGYHDTNLSSHNDESRRGKYGLVLQDEMIKIWHKCKTDRWRGEKKKTVTDILPNCLVSDFRQKVIQERCCRVQQAVAPHCVQLSQTLILKKFLLRIIVIETCI